MDKKKMHNHDDMQHWKKYIYYPIVLFRNSVINKIPANITPIKIQTEYQEILKFPILNISLLIIYTPFYYWFYYQFVY